MDFKGVDTFIGSSGPRSKLIYHDDTIYEGWIGSTCTLMHKGILVIVSCIGDSEKVL